MTQTSAPAMPNARSHSTPQTTPLEIEGSGATTMFAKIVATIGPASESPEVVRKLILAGVSVFRFNFSHGDLATHATRLKTVRDVASELSRPIAILGDLQGPKIRVGKIPAGVGTPSPSGGGSIVVEQGQDVVFKKGLADAYLRTSPTNPSSREPVLPVTYELLIDEVKPGQRVLINDGAIRMLAVEHDATAGELRCRVTIGGTITSHKGINLPQSDVSAPAITERDWECVAFAVEHAMDYIALSFVRSAEEVKALRAQVNALCEAKAHRDGLQSLDGVWIPIVSKIEKPQALADLERIVESSDAVMVARGDLGVEMDIAQVPIAQKRIIRTCAQFGRPCIVATQMLETMIENSTPTRAEASDVANAIFDGTDAVMLSAETATGKHPVLVVETMSRIVTAAEAQVALGPPLASPDRITHSHRSTAALAHGAWQVARDLNAKAVVCWSEQGGTARYLSQNNFHMPIIAYSSSPRATRRMALYNAVTPVCALPPGNGTIAEWTAAADQFLLSRRLASASDMIVLLAGRPLGKAKATNTIAIHEVAGPSDASLSP